MNKFLIVFLIFFFIGNAPKAEDIATEQEQLYLWNYEKFPKLDDCLGYRNNFFLKGVELILIRFPYNLNHFSSQDSGMNEFVHEYNLNKGTTIEKFIDKYFADSCIPVMSWEKSGYHNFQGLPTNILVLEIYTTAVDNEFIPYSENLMGYITFSSKLKRSLGATAYHQSARKVENSLVFYDSLYPRTILIPADFKSKEMAEKIEEEIIIQLDYNIARMIFGKPIRKPQLSDSKAYHRYGTLEGNQDVPWED